MKTNLHTTHLVALAIAVTLAVLTQPAVFSQTNDIIQMTENSPTSLSVTLNGSTSGIFVNNTSADHWTITFPTNIMLNEGVPVGWIEPENSANGNIVSSPSQNNFLFVVSDALGHPLNEPDGALVALGFDTNTGLQVEGAFHDNAATAEATVPDTGSTLVLLFLALTALFGASRFRALRV